MQNFNDISHGKQKLWAIRTEKMLLNLSMGRPLPTTNSGVARRYAQDFKVTFNMWMLKFHQTNLQGLIKTIRDANL